jgi:4-amino-4-deoxy-L-arabinose transferase-like glycosyltransferase
MPTVTYQNGTLLIVLAITALHLLLAPSVGLSVDEAHYALYAYFPDLSYFDHPPLIGWLLWLLTPWGLDEFTLRIPSAVIYLLCSALLYHITAHRLSQGTPRKGLLAVSLFSLAPMVQLLGFGLVPEFPLLLWSLILAQLAQNLDADSTLPHWLLFGLLIGLAGLSKYTAVLLLPSLILYWLIHHKLGRILCSPRLYAAILVATVLISPVLIWNYQHDWASFRYQIDHASGGDWEIGELLKAFGVQLLTYSPLLVIGGIIALKDVVQPGMRSLLACIAAPILLFVTLGAGNGSSLPHWTLVAWTLLTPSVSHWVVDNWSRRPIRWLAISGTTLSALLSSLILIIAAFQPPTIMRAPGLRDLVGWQEAAQRANELRREHLPQDGVIMVHNWARASRIAWYAWPTAVQVLDRRPGQFAYWYGVPDEHSQGILIRDNVKRNATEPYNKMGFRCDFLENHTVAIDGIDVNRFDYYLCRHSASPSREKAVTSHSE